MMITLAGNEADLAAYYRFDDGGQTAQDSVYYAARDWLNDWMNAAVFVNGAAQWWFDVGGNRYDNPTLMKRIAGYVRNAREVLALDRSPVDQVAFVVDEDSLTRLRVADPLGRRLLLAQIPALRRLGAPSGDYLTADLRAIMDRKLFIFPTSFAPDAAQRRTVDALKGDGRVLVFLYAPGIYNPRSRIDESAMQRFTGIRLRLRSTPGVLRVTIADAADPLVKGLHGTAYGPKGRRTLPAVWGDDPDAEVLGTLPDGTPGLVIRRFPKWTAVFSAAPLLPAALLRNLARLADVHLYIDTPDVVWASHDLLAVSVDKGGPRLIHLPRICDVRDLYTGEPVAAAVREFRAKFAPKATRVFVLRTPQHAQP
jgi:hypothetical protein